MPASYLQFAILYRVSFIGGSTVPTESIAILYRVSFIGGSTLHTQSIATCILCRASFIGGSTIHTQRVLLSGTECPLLEVPLYTQRALLLALSPGHSQFATLKNWCGLGMRLHCYLVQSVLYWRFYYTHREHCYIALTCRNVLSSTGDPVEVEQVIIVTLKTLNSNDLNVNIHVPYM